MAEPVLPLYVGVDVGSTSVRSALVDAKGKIHQQATQSITIFTPKQDFYQQSTEDIWKACVTTVREVTKTVAPAQIRGIGFDATCSMAVLDVDFQPLSVSPQGEAEQNVIMWLDHRASKQADFINSTGHQRLQGYGGKMSLENEPPKLLWLKQNMPESWWKRAGYFFDLPDFMTWRATGCLSRSLCSLVCKWAYRADESGHGWDSSFWEILKLGDVLEDDAIRIGTVVQNPGKPVGSGLSAEAAEELGLVAGTAVATSVIDAHSGGIGLLGCETEADRGNAISTRLALICGTSTCHMAVNPKRTLVNGVWGPYYSAMVPNLWLSEGGQSATGKLVDHIIDSHPATRSLRERLGTTKHVQAELTDILNRLQQSKNTPSVSQLTVDLNVWPDFHGNRSPVADSTLKGMVSGLSLSATEEDLALLYLATIQALAYGTKHIMEAMTKAGHEFKSVLICGGLSKNSLFVQTHADVLELPVIVPQETESMLLGAAMLAAYASHEHPTLESAMRTMGGKGTAVLPQQQNYPYHNKKYKVFLKMLSDQQNYRNIMNN